MRQDFLLTRWVLILAALAGAVWWASSLGTRRDAVTAAVDHSPPAPTAAAAMPAAPASADWDQALLAPEIQALWRERRGRLDRLSRAYRTEPDSARAAELRRQMEALIARSVREVYELRLAHARRDSQPELARRLERALADLPPPAGAPPQPQRRCEKNH
ncbi:MAG: hypothetical protein R3D98_10990 [Candidatus Krumholzibacteriia bacterium]